MQASPVLPVSQLARPKRRLTGAIVVVLVAALCKLLLHLLTAGNYGLFTDELYFLAAGEHLAWGYVDMPPLTAVQAALARVLFGESVFGIHVLPALLGAGLVLLVALVVHALDGDWLAQALAGLAVIIAPGYLLVDSYLSMNSVELLIWLGCAYLVIRIIQTGDTRLWLAFGALAGLGMLNKHTTALFVAAVVAGLLLTPQRKLIWNRWFLLGGALGLLIFLPNLIWMFQHDFPFLELQANIRANRRNVELSALEFLRDVVVFMHPLTLPVWLGGLAYFFFHPQGKRYRALGWAFLFVLAALLVTHARTYYLMPAFPMLFAGGAVLIGGWARPGARRWLTAGYLALMIAGGIILAPTGLPVLSPESYVKYERSLHLAPPDLETAATGTLPQLYADRFGWPEMAQKTAEVYRSLTPEEQKVAAIFGNNYGEAGAIDFYGPNLGLPKAIGGHLNYWYWGPRDYTGEIVIGLGVDPASLPKLFDSCEIAARADDPWSMPRERFPIYLCRGLKMPLNQLWPELKKWD